MGYILDELLSLHAKSKPCATFSQPDRPQLDPFQYATAKAAGFDMTAFTLAQPRYVRC